MRGLISPSKIISNNRGEITPEAFSQFMRGEGNGSLGSSIADSANNIVNFSRSTVAPASPNFSSLLGIISTNINNFKSEINQNIQGQVQNITKNIIQRVEGQVQNITKNIIQRVEGIPQEVQGQIKEVQGQIQNITKNIIQRVEELTKINLNQNVNNAQFINNAPQISKEDSVEQNKFIQNQIENITQNNQNELKNIAQNINKTFFNTIQRLQTDSQNILSSTIQKFTTEYREQIKETADNQPSNVLKNFQNLYKSTIDFVTFLGDAKTNNRITKSLVSLRRMFEESLNVSVVIREAIVKIVDQLTNLPSASPSAGGLELDVDVPGGPLKQTGGSLGRTGSRAGLGRRLGLGALGLGIGAAGVGVGAAGAGMLSAKKFQEEKLQSTRAQAQPQEQMIPDDFIKNFQKLIEVFDTSINNLIDFVKSSSGEGGGRTSPGGGGGNSSPNNQLPSQPANIEGNEKELLKRLMIAEASGEGIEGMAMVGRSVLNRAALIQSGVVTPGTFDARSGSVTDVIQAPKQYTPYAEGKLDRPLSADENTRAEQAYQLIFNDPEFRRRISSKFGLSGDLVNRAAAATGFRNYNAGAGLDYSQKVKEFNAGSHTFNVAGNEKELTPYSSAVINQPVIPSTQPQAQPTNAPQSSAKPSQVAPNPASRKPLETSHLNEPLSTVTVASLPQQPPSVLPSNGGSNQSSLKSLGGGAGANSGVYVGEISSKNLFGGFSLNTRINFGIV